MAFDGFGTFLRLRSWIADATANVKIRADFHDDEDNNFAAGLSQCIVKDGQTTISQNIPFNSKRIISLADPVDPQDAATKDYADTKMPLDGSVPITGDVIIKNDDPSLTLDGKDGFKNSIFGQKGEKNRWEIVLGNATLESGSNAGSNFELINYADDGTLIGDVLFGTRSTGLLTVKGDPTAALGIATKQYTDTAANNAIVAANNRVLRTGDTMTGQLTVNGAGIYATGPIQTGSTLFASGRIQTSSDLLVSGPVEASSYINVSDSVYCKLTRSNGVINYINLIRGDPAVAGRDILLLAYNQPGALYGMRVSTNTFGAYFDFLNDGQAYKAGGGTWASASDARIKTVLGDYENGLAAVNALQPVRFVYKGNDSEGPPSLYAGGEKLPGEEGVVERRGAPAVPYPNSFHYAAAVDQTEFIGLIAQDAETVMPEMVEKTNGYIDGQEVSDLRTMDTGPLLFALINAVKELTTRIATLEGASNK